MNKICVYTCITGDYDNLKEIKNIEQGIDYICYTNNHNIKSNTWNVKFIENDKELSNVKLARKIKILGTKELKKYDTVLWMDADISFDTSIKDFITKFVDLKKHDLVGFKHFCRNSIKEEILANIECFNISYEEALKVERFLKNEKFPDNLGLIESTLIFRNFNNKKVIETMNIWFDCIKDYSHRDQLFFNYAAWKTKINFNLIDIVIWKNEYFHHAPHNALKKITFSFFENNDSPIENSETYSIKFIDNVPFSIKYKLKNDCDNIRISINTDYGLVANKMEVLVNDEIITDWHNNHEIFYNGKIYFINFPYIRICRSFHKNDVVVINFQLQGIHKYHSAEIMCELEKYRSDYFNIISSKRWKTIDKVFNFANKLIKKK